MSRIGRSGAAVVVLSGSLFAGGAGAVQAEPLDLVPEICDELGPDTFVHADSPGEYAGRQPVVVWVDVTRTDPETGRYLSHERVLPAASDASVDEICSFDVGGGLGSVTLGLEFDDPSGN